MAQDINRVVLTGNLTRDPELRYKGELAICNLRVANNQPRRRDGEWTEKANFFDVVIFGGQGENAARHLAKGRQVAIDGRLDWSEWTDDHKIKHQAVNVIADDLRFLGSPPQEAQAPADPDAGLEPVTSVPDETPALV